MSIPSLRALLQKLYYTIFRFFLKKIWTLEDEVRSLKEINSELNYKVQECTAQLLAHQKQLSLNREYYLKLLHNCLTGVIYDDPPIAILGQKKYDTMLREYGWDWPSKAHTMIGSKRLANVRLLVESVLGNNVQGDLIETGVWRGGACIMMRGILAAYDIRNRRVWLADSFCGLPKPDTENYPQDTGETFHEFEELSVSIETVQNNFRRYGLLDEQVVFLKGWFKDTLPQAPIERIAVLRLDGDLYESTIQPLEALYDKVSDNGFIIVDDYHVVSGCKQAVHDFWAKRNLSPELCEIDGVGVFWKKTPKELKKDFNANASYDTQA